MEAAQTVGPLFIPIFTDKRAEVAFVGGKTIVTEVEFNGLDENLED